MIPWLTKEYKKRTPSPTPPIKGGEVIDVHFPLVGEGKGVFSRE